MTSESDSGTTTRSDDMADVLSRVRQVDPTAEDAAVRGYVREIAEASALLDTIDLADAPLIVAFSPSWPEESVR
jgi:hypothetical protein